MSRKNQYPRPKYNMGDYLMVHSVIEGEPSAVHRVQGIIITLDEKEAARVEYASGSEVFSEADVAARVKVEKTRTRRSRAKAQPELVPQPQPEAAAPQAAAG